MDGLLTLHFHGALKNLLRKPWPGGQAAYPLTRRASIKDVIEALGPPHTEIGRLLVDGAEVDFHWPAQAGQTVAVFPACFPIRVTTPTVLRPVPLSGLAFAADANVGKLATLLRLLGYDVTYDRSIDDAALAKLAATTGRVVLSRDRNCLKRSAIVYGRLIRANNPVEQVRDVIEAYGLREGIRPFSRCLRCNALLAPVAKATVLNRLEPKTKRYYEDFVTCPDCGRIYWAGSHHEGMQRLLNRIMETSKSLATPALSPGTGPGAIDKYAGPCRR